MQVTTKGAGLNPNAQVWQEIPAHQDDIPQGTEDSSWLHPYPHTEINEGLGSLTSLHFLFFPVIMIIFLVKVGVYKSCNY